MTFFIDLFEYLMTENETEISVLIRNVFIKICDNIDVDTLSILDVLNETSEHYVCVNYISYQRHGNMFENNILIEKDIEFNTIFTNEETESYYSMLEFDDEKFVIFFYKIGSINREIQFADYIKLVKNIFYYKSRISNIDQKKLHFIMNMSHEVRTPLNAIITMSELLIKKRTETAENNKLLQIIKVSGIELLCVVNNILDYSRVLTNKMTLRMNPMSLTKTIKTMLTILDAEIMHKEIDLISDISVDIPDMIISDDIRLKQLLLNILTQSINTTDEGYVKLKVSCDQSDEHKCLILFQIIDTGSGIDSDEIDKVYHFFNKLDSDYFSGECDTGVNLAIARHIITLMKGRIWIQNNESKGTIVNISIPFAKFKANIDNELIKDYYANNRALILSTNSEERVILIGLFSNLKINPVLVTSVEELLVYVTHDEHIKFVFISNGDLANEHAIKINNMIPEIVKILIENDDVNNNKFVHDYKLSKPISEENILTILGTIYTISKYNLIDTENEVYFERKIVPSESLFEDKTFSVLVVEDNEQNQKCMENILKYKKITDIEKALDGREALEKMIEKKYDLILMDIRLPVKNGIDVTKEYKQLFPDSDSFIVAVTAGISEDIKRQCKEAKMDAFLPKPVNIENFSRLLNTLTEKNK